MDKKDAFSRLHITSERTFITLLGSILFLGVLLIGAGMMYRQLSGFTSTQEQPSKPDSADDGKQKSNYGIREPGYGRQLEGL